MVARDTVWELEGARDAGNLFVYGKNYGTGLVPAKPTGTGTSPKSTRTVLF